MLRSYALWIGVMLCLLAGCDPGEPTYKVDLRVHETPSVQQEDHSITYAYLPQYSHTISYQKHHQLVAYLRQKTGLNIRQIFPDTFDGHLEMVGQGKIDLSFANPVHVTSRWRIVTAQRPLRESSKKREGLDIKDRSSAAQTIPTSTVWKIAGGNDGLLWTLGRAEDICFR